MQAGLSSALTLQAAFDLCPLLGPRVFSYHRPNATKARPADLSAAAFPTSCRRQHIGGVPQPHEIKLVKPPVLLVGRGHRVLAPLVDDLVSRVTVWK